MGPTQPHLTGILALLGTAFFAALLTRIQLVLTWDDQAPWWASNGRDILNGFSVLALTTALAAMGYPAEVAVAIAAHLVAFAALVEWALHRLAIVGADAIAVGTSVVAVTPLALWPAQASSLAAAVLNRLTP